MMLCGLLKMASHHVCNNHHYKHLIFKPNKSQYPLRAKIVLEDSLNKQRKARGLYRRAAPRKFLSLHLKKSDAEAKRNDNVSEPKLVYQVTYTIIKRGMKV
mmetsp:Transcript_28592/g.57542  ORF Transcript_28592/g.57542 Transcript_28592/m.57542 type:complete len:101 (+) Transcript_28592:339-641(+)